MIMNPAMSQEKIAAGPAITEALKAPNNHPEPIIEPIAAKRIPIGPRCRFSLTSGTLPFGCALLDIIVSCVGGVFPSFVLKPHFGKFAFQLLCLLPEYLLRMPG
ncbi:hypothetical protein [Paenarthrobacter sp. Z7-10]|uniref:hypothetical protein n=1 Tax=Paenarthrobacter sp. Z7-10 TaxID=2787635 RepID=UPI0022A95DE3|nr:hypothetical protein [Paenarthrobacter sp. Z7-10]